VKKEETLENIPQNRPMKTYLMYPPGFFCNCYYSFD